MLSNESEYQEQTLLGLGQDRRAAEFIVTNPSRMLRSAPKPPPIILGARAFGAGAQAIGALACLLLSVHVISNAPYSGSDSWFRMGRALAFLHAPHSGLLYQTLFFSEHIK